MSGTSLPTTSPSAPTAALELHALCRTYDGGRVRAVDGLSVRLLAGTFTAVMGPSGSGKSTFLQCAAGLDVPTSGRVLLAGHDLAALSERRRTRLRRDRIGVVFQAFNLVDSLTAAQNVALPARLARRRITAAEIVAALADVGLAGRAAHRPAQLSGGEQQRVAIARALATRPDVLFADEPTGALDSAASAGVLELLRRIVTDGGSTVVMVTHDPVAAAHADAVVLLRDGRLDGTIPVDPRDPATAGRIARHLAGAGA